MLFIATAKTFPLIAANGTNDLPFNLSQMLNFCTTNKPKLKAS
jgi:hypothetical protein